MRSVLHQSIPVLFALGVMATVGCDDKDDDDDGSSSSSSSSTGDPEVWIVGEQGAMVRLDEAGETSDYPLDLAEDLLAIACKGADTAWAVGASGVLIRTVDGGDTWDTIDTGTSADLRAVATSGGARVFAVGDAGTVLVSNDEGVRFQALNAPSADFSGVATDATGTGTLLVDREGTIWRIRGESVDRIADPLGRPLHGVALTPDGGYAAAVGAAGTVLVSADGGETWTSIPEATPHDLRAVRVSADGTWIVAVGDAGTVVTHGPAGTSTQQVVDEALDLHALHLGASGRGQAVGDAGIVLQTRDAGWNWEPLAVAGEVSLFGVDHLHAEPHL